MFSLIPTRARPSLHGRGEPGTVPGARADVVQRQPVGVPGRGEQLLRLRDVAAVAGGRVQLVLAVSELRRRQDLLGDQAAQGAAAGAPKRLTVEGVVDRLPHLEVADRSCLRVRVQRHVLDAPVGLRREARLEGRIGRDLREARDRWVKVERHVGVAADDRLRACVRGRAFGHLDRVDPRLAQRIGLRAPVGVALEGDQLPGLVRVEHVRAERDDVLRIRRADGVLGRLLLRDGREEAHAENRQEVAGGLRRG